MAAPKGNNYNMKWKTAEERQAVCKRLCEHLAAGLTQECFVEADWDTVERYMYDFPEDFPPQNIEAARKAGRMRLEQAGMDGMYGHIKNFNPTVWIFMMKNKYGWSDRKEVTHTGSLDINNLSDEELEAKIAALQDEEV